MTFLLSYCSSSSSGRARATIAVIICWNTFGKHNINLFASWTQVLLPSVPSMLVSRVHLGINVFQINIESEGKESLASVSTIMTGTEEFTFIVVSWVIKARWREIQIAPCKGIHDSLGFSILPCGFRIPSTGFRIPAQWIPDSKKGWIPNFFLF